MENNESNNVEEAVFEPVSSEPAGSSRTERQWAMGCHLIGLCGLLIPNLVLGLAGTLVLWLVKREDGAFVDQQGKEALNFQISLFIYASICLFLIVIGIGLLLLFPLIIFGFVCIIVAGIKASEGVAFRYPLCIRFIK